MTSNPVSTPTRSALGAWEALWRAHTLLLQHFQQDDIWHPVSMREYDVLYALTLAPHQALRLGELAAKSVMPQPSISRIVEQLVQKGLVERQQVTQDRRGVTVHLTPQGKQVQQQVGRKHTRTVTQHMAGALSTSELDELQALCTRLAHANQTTQQPESNTHE